MICSWSSSKKESWANEPPLDMWIYSWLGSYYNCRWFVLFTGVNKFRFTTRGAPTIWIHKSCITHQMIVRSFGDPASRGPSPYSRGCESLVCFLLMQAWPLSRRTSQACSEPHCLSLQPRPSLKGLHNLAPPFTWETMIQLGQQVELPAPATSWPVETAQHPGHVTSRQEHANPSAILSTLHGGRQQQASLSNVQCYKIMV